MSTWVIVPAYNEAHYLGHFLDALMQYTHRIVVVDDGSTDSTAKLVADRHLVCLSHLVNLGKGAALKTGCQYAFQKRKASAVVVMDGDGQHHPTDYLAFIRELDHGADIVLGIRSLDAKMPLLRVLGNKFVSLLVSLLFGHYIADIPSGFKAFTKKAYHKLLWHSAGYEVETEFAVRLAKSNLPYVEIPIQTVYHDKDYGFNFFDAFFILLKLPYWFWR